MKKISEFQFLVVKFSIYLNRRVFVMIVIQNMKDMKNKQKKKKKKKKKQKQKQTSFGQLNILDLKKSRFFHASSLSPVFFFFFLFFFLHFDLTLPHKLMEDKLIELIERTFIRKPFFCTLFCTK